MLKDYQRNGIGYRVLHSIMEKVQTTKPVSLQVVVPAADWMHSKLVSFGFVKATQEVNNRGYELWQCTFASEGNRSFRAFLTFLASKASIPL